VPPGENYTIVGPESLAGGFSDSEAENSTSKLNHSHRALHHPHPMIRDMYLSLGVFVHRYNLPRDTRAGIARSWRWLCLYDEEFKLNTLEP